MLETAAHAVLQREVVVTSAELSRNQGRKPRTAHAESTS